MPVDQKRILYVKLSEIFDAWSTHLKVDLRHILQRYAAIAPKLLYEPRVWVSFRIHLQIVRIVECFRDVLRFGVNCQVVLHAEHEVSR